MRTWKKPIVVEIAVGMEINCYVCAELQISWPGKPDQADQFVGLFDSSNLLNDKIPQRRVGAITGAPVLLLIVNYASDYRTWRRGRWWISAMELQLH